MTDHPTPWRRDPCLTANPGIVDANGKRVATVLPGNVAEIAERIELICTAVNAYHLLWDAVMLSASFFEHGAPKRYRGAQAACLKALQLIYEGKAQ